MTDALIPWVATLNLPLFLAALVSTVCRWAASHWLYPTTRGEDTRLWRRCAGIGAPASWLLTVFATVLVGQILLAHGELANNDTLGLYLGAIAGAMLTSVQMGFNSLGQSYWATLHKALKKGVAGGRIRDQRMRAAFGEDGHVLLDGEPIERGAALRRIVGE